MNNFCNVVSNSTAQSKNVPPIPTKLRYGDLQQLFNTLYVDTVESLADFQRKSLAIVEWENLIHKNTEKLAVLDEWLRNLIFIQKQCENELDLEETLIANLQKTINEYCGCVQDCLKYKHNLKPKANCNPSTDFYSKLPDFNQQINALRNDIELLQMEIDTFKTFKPNNPLASVSKLIGKHLVLLEDIESKSIKLKDQLNMAQAGLNDQLHRKDTKLIEKEYDEFISNTVNQLSDYFMKLHGILQRVETQLMAKIKKEMTSSVEKILKNRGVLSKSMKSLEEMIVTLENIVSGHNRNKSTFIIPDVISRSNKILQSLACEAVYENNPNSQFTLTEIPNIEEIFDNCLNIKSTEDLISHVYTYFGEEVLDVEEDTLKNNTNNINSNINANHYNNNKKKINNNKKHTFFKKTDPDVVEHDSFVQNSLPIKILQRPKINTFVKNELSLSANQNKYTNKNFKKNFNVTNKLEVINVHVSHIKNPVEFYVQKDEFKSNLVHLESQFKLEAGIALTVSYVDVDEIYLVHNSGSWHRGRVIEIINPDLCIVFLIDIGITLSISKKNIKIMPDNLQVIPAGAQKCSVYGIKHKGEHWTDDANLIVAEVIADYLIQMVIVKKEENHFLVDLITTKTTPTSLRDALIHTDNADTVDILNDKILIKNLVEYNRIKQNLIPPITKSFFENNLELSIEIPIIALNVISPDEFYVINVADEKNIEEMQTNLYDVMYKKGTVNHAILVPRENMPCAVNIEGKWFRASVVSVDSRVKCEVYLVDFGEFKEVTWNQLRLLDNKFLKYNKYAFPCSLIDVEPIEGLEWSVDAIDEFKRFCQSKSLLIYANHNINSGQLAYKVTLYISKPNMDLNVNAMMVKAKHAISTGFESKRIEFPKENIKIKPKNLKDNGILNVSSKPKLDDKDAGRRKIQIVHIVSPGEFYINLESYIPSIKNIQKEIKSIQNRKIKEIPNFLTNQEWKLDDNCLALATIPKGDSETWYRAQIIKITVDNENSPIYSVYLRDYGYIINKLNKNQISPIDDSLNRVIDNALRCNLACSKPTGDLPNWSKSSIDYFNDLAKLYDNSLYASIYGELKNKSFPIILWAKINEPCNPLSSDTFRWCNLNMQLVNEGYAHLIESFNKIIDSNWKAVEDDLNKIKVAVINPKELKVIDEVFEVSRLKRQEVVLNSTVQLDLNDSDIESMVDWLPAKPIEKSLFTGIPTFVDDNAHIFLHDATQTENINIIKNFINNKFQSRSITNQESIVWQVDDPCIARFHLDDLFYRAKIVEPLSNGNYKVLFVDYGDIEECAEKDLIKEICLSKVPIQVNIYKLDGIKPCTSNGKWTRENLDLIHLSIVLKHCTIRVEANSMNRKDLIKKCSISTSDIGDLGKYLIGNKIAVKHNDGFLTSNAGKLLLKAIHGDGGNTKENSYSETEDEILSRFGDNQITEKEPKDFYHDYFERQELLNLEELEKLSEDENNDLNNLTYQSGRWQHSHIDCGEMGEKLLSDDEDDIRENEIREDDIRENDKQDKDSELGAISDDEKNQKNFELNTTCNSFNPKDTSTVVSRFDGLELFSRCQIPHNIRGFYCEIKFIRSSLNFFVSPLLPEPEKKFHEMSTSIQNYIKYGIPKQEPVALREPCLALFSEDNLWYRALIRSKSRTNNTYDIIYVDFMNNDKVAVENLLNIPKMYLKYPLRLIEVQMCGLKPNERWHEIDIKRRLTDVLNYKKVYCKIKKWGKIPIVDFYESSSCMKLVFDSMIKEKYYLIDK